MPVQWFGGLWRSRRWGRGGIGKGGGGAGEPGCGQPGSLGAGEPGCGQPGSLGAGEGAAGVVVLRSRGSRRAYRSAASVMLSAQLLLWAAITGTGPEARSLWQTALLLVPVGLGVWGVSARAWGQPSRRCRWELWLLLPCPVLDAILLVHSLLALLVQLMPSYPPGILRVVIPALLTAGVLLGREDGAAYGVCLWRWMPALLCGLVVWQAVEARGFDRLFPMGDGREAAALLPGGLGPLWAIAALFVALPEAEESLPGSPGGPVREPGLRFVLVPLTLLAAYALALCCAAPWTVAGGQPLGIRLLWLGRSCGNGMLSGLGALLWLLLCMLGYCMALLLGRRLVHRLCPGLRRGWPVVAGAALVACASLWLWPDALPPWLPALLPWRFALWAAAAVTGLLRRRAG